MKVKEVLIIISDAEKISKRLGELVEGDCLTTVDIADIERICEIADGYKDVLMEMSLK